MKFSAAIDAYCDDMLAQGLTKEFDPAWGDPRFFLRSSYRGLWGHVRELGAS